MSQEIEEINEPEFALTRVTIIADNAAARFALRRLQ